MTLAGAEAPIDTIALKPKPNDKSQAFDEQVHEARLATLESGLELEYSARDLHSSVGDEAAELPDGLVDGGGGIGAEAPGNRISAGIGIGIQVLGSRSELGEDRDHGEFLERGLWDPQFLEQRSVRLH